MLLFRTTKQSITKQQYENTSRKYYIILRIFYIPMKSDKDDNKNKDNLYCRLPEYFEKYI